MGGRRMKVFIRDMKILKDELISSIKQTLLMVIPLTSFAWLVSTFMTEEGQMLPASFLMTASILVGLTPLIGFFYVYFSNIKRIIQRNINLNNIKKKYSTLYNEFMNESYR